MAQNNSQHTAQWTGLLSDAAATHALAHWFGLHTPCGTVIALDGPLGAGKTAFAQGFMAGLGVAGPVVSPTFILLNRYEGRCPAGHIDLYRLQAGADDGGFLLELDELLDGQTILLVEWANRLPHWLPAEYLQVDLDYLTDPAAGRRVTITARGEALAKLLAQLQTDLPREVQPDVHLGP